MAMTEIVEGQFIEGGDGIDADTAREFADFIDEMRSTETADAWITVLRVPVDAQGNPRPNTKAVGQLFSEPMGAATVQDIVERIRDGFIRPGETKICVRIMGSTKGTGGKLRFNKVMTIEKANTKANDARPDSISEIMRVMQENQRINDERFERMMQGARVSVVQDPIDQMTKMMTAMGAMMAPMMAVMAGRPVTGASESPSKQLMEVATTMKTLQGLFGGNNPGDDEGGAAILKSIASIATPAIQLMAETKRNETERLRLAGPARRQAITGNRGSVPGDTAHAAKTTAAAQSAPVSPETVQEQKPVTEEQKMQLEEMKKNLDTICDLRDSGKSAAQVAKLVLATVPPESDEAFLQMLDSDDYVPNMTLLNPRVGHDVAWAEALRRALLDEYEPDAEAPTK